LLPRRSPPPSVLPLPQPSPATVVALLLLLTDLHCQQPDLPTAARRFTSVAADIDTTGIHRRPSQLLPAPKLSDPPRASQICQIYLARRALPSPHLRSTSRISDLNF
ncbi:hypothetical protein U1Q18_012257, partial [Sarracenia purpurea var. burkii]